MGGLGAAGAVGNKLLHYDNVYNADHADCKFRDFVYNVCTTGQSEAAAQRERLLVTQRGGAHKEEQWVVAKRDNPDPERMYPAPIHFQAGLLKRVESQRAHIEGPCHNYVDMLRQKMNELAALEASNAQRARKLRLE